MLLKLKWSNIWVKYFSVNSGLGSVCVLNPWCLRDYKRESRSYSQRSLFCRPCSLHTLLYIKLESDLVWIDKRCPWNSHNSWLHRKSTQEIVHEPVTELDIIDQTYCTSEPWAGGRLKITWKCPLDSPCTSVKRTSRVIQASPFVILKTCWLNALQSQQ